MVLGTAYGIASGIVVDTHVSRISQRLDLTKNTDPVKIEQDLVKIIPKERWILFSHQMILHGRALCMARAPECGKCDLNSLCYAADNRRRSRSRGDEAGIDLSGSCEASRRPCHAAAKASALPSKPPMQLEIQTCGFVETRAQGTDRGARAAGAKTAPSKQA